jgi:hypothetical protein
MTHALQSLIDAPLANACKVNLPAGKRSAPRAKPHDLSDDIGCPKLSTKELREIKKRNEAAKLASLFDYYATTELTGDRVAEHMGLYRQERTGEDKEGKPIFSRVLDVERADQQLAWRRKAA